MSFLTSALLCLTSFAGSGDFAALSNYLEEAGNRYVITDSLPFEWITTNFTDVVPTDEANKEDEVKKDEPKKEEPKKDEEVKKDEPKKEEPKEDEVKKDEPKKEEPKKDEVKKDEPKKEESKKDEAKKDEPKKEESKKDEPKSKYETIDVKASKLKVAEDFSACIIPEEITPISLNVTEWTNSFRVVSVKPHGSKVSKGDKLIELDTESYDNALADLRRSVKGLEIAFQKAEAAIETARKTNELELLQVKQGIDRNKETWKHFWDVEWPAKLESIELNAQLTKTRLDAQREEFNQLKKMFEADDLVEHEEEFLLKRQKLELDVAEFNYKLAVEKYNRTKAVELPQTEEDNKQKYERLLSVWEAALKVAPLAIKEAELEFEGQKVALERARAKLAKMEKQRAQLECRAPADGIFLYGSFENNKYVGFDVNRVLLKPEGLLPLKKTVAVIVSGTSEASITIPEKLWSSMDVGFKGWFTLNAYPNNELMVSLKSFTDYPVAEGEYQGTVKINGDIPNNVKLLPGMKGKVKLVLKEKSKAIMIPQTALGREGYTTDRFVYVLNGDKAVKRAVKTGYTTEKSVEIVDGLESGEKVVKDWTKVEE